MIITVINQKGGVGKTTTSQALALSFQDKGYKVLVVDLDGQASLSKICNADEDKQNIYEVLNNGLNIKSAIQRTFIDIVPSDDRLYDLQSNVHQLNKLNQSLEEVRNDYDFIIIDTAPALSNLSISSLISADKVIIPAHADLMSLEGISLLSETLSTAKSLNPKLEVLGIVVSQYDSRTNLDKEAVKILNEVGIAMGAKLFDTKIRKSVAIKEYQGKKENMFNYNNKNNAISDYEQLAEEILKELDQSE